jgi:hypothetical protein
MGQSPARVLVIAEADLGLSRSVHHLAGPAVRQPRAVQLRLPGFARDSLVEPGAKVRVSALWRLHPDGRSAVDEG